MDVKHIGQPLMDKFRRLQTHFNARGEAMARETSSLECRRLMGQYKDAAGLVQAMLEKAEPGELSIVGLTLMAMSFQFQQAAEHAKGSQQPAVRKEIGQLRGSVRHIRNISGALLVVAKLEK